MMSPGPELKIAVQCSMRSGETLTQVSTKVFNVSVIDRNDNLIKVQDRVTNLTLSSPYFQQVGVGIPSANTCMPQYCQAALLLLYFPRILMKVEFCV